MMQHPTTKLQAAKILSNAFFYLERREEESTSAYQAKRQAQSMLVSRINDLFAHVPILETSRLRILITVRVDRKGKP